MPILGASVLFLVLTAPAQTAPQKFSSQQVHNLALLGQVWGFLKYYHPVVAKGKFDWDKELFQKIPVVKNAKNGEELSAILLNRTDGLGAVRACRGCDNLPADAVTYNLDEKWMKDENFSKAFRHRGPVIMYNMAKRWKLFIPTKTNTTLRGWCTPMKRSDCIFFSGTGTRSIIFFRIKM